MRALVRNRDAAREIQRLGATLHLGDVLDADTITESARSCDVIFHTAAAITVPGGWEEYRRLNIDGTRNAVAAAETTGARLLHLSSVAVYGSAGRYTASGAKTNEDTEVPLAKGDSDYTRSKRQSEALVLAAHRGGRVWATAVRPDVIYGPRDRQFVPRLGRLLSWGFAPTIGQGKTTMALVHAANVADGAVRAATTDRAGGRAFNLANDFDVTVEEFFRLAAQGLGRRVRLVRIPLWAARAAVGGIRQIDSVFLGGKFSVATAGSLDFLSRDNPFTSERARTELGWSPLVRPADGVPAAFRWWRDLASR